MTDLSTSSTFFINIFSNPKLVILLIVLIYLIVINFVGFFAMLIDKKKAVKGKWRISEGTLMIIAAIGGAVGSLLGMRKFRHKTKHRKFTIGIPLLLILHIAIIIVIIYFYYF